MASSNHRSGRSGRISPFALTTRPTFVAIGLLFFLVAALLVATMRATEDVSAASLGTITAATDVKVEVNDTPITPTVSVRDRFSGLGSDDLDGRLTDYNGGNGYKTDEGPPFVTVAGGVSASGTWHGKSSGVQRDLGVNYSAALVPWLTRKSALSVRMTGTIDNTTDGGMVINTNATGTNGVAVRINCTGAHPNLTCQAQLRNITGAATSTACSSTVTINSGNKPSRFDVTNFINDAGAVGDDITVTVDKTGGAGGTAPVTLTCEPAAAATGAHAGLISFAPSTSMRFDNLVLSLS